MKSILVSVFLLSSSLTFAQDAIISFETKEVPLAKKDHLKMDSAMEEMPGFGEILGHAQGLVALGESIYSLVQKGKPVIKHRFATINVVPRTSDGRKYVDPFELEETSDAIKKKYVVVAKNKLKQEVVRFEYMVLFHVGKYEGKGKYIQNAIIIPQSSKASYGFELNSQMKLLGVANKGTKANPVASAILNISYAIGSVITQYKSNDTFTLSGNGTIVKE